ncbi:adenosylcobinamide-GDP ribazoletransferase [Tropicibacter naphthalenivorans]|uniref:Adenosylcobinamide-GDP ribazoletransferase n=1 Tax=Tropicibacter naphthalenivorans TaxID=441103 RepID=A0A0P1GG82_9RHOB|nr:adenosylcobinamide-GDP ribazoletransferase [Tropicibacter naphthalenivorans]CUH80853.1 Cobalamin synthase [Tropicibacter naphthalenivorans]SMC90660.1 cobalamin-5'-phosphate synthase [Tropicibacter naphthalenivorans]
MTPLATRLTEFRVAIMLLSRLPAGQLRGEVPPLAAASWAYPLAGLPIGLIVWAAHAGLLTLGASAVIAALLAFTVLVLVTGALHQDGLADFADGLGGGRDKAHCLEIMRDSRIGSYGVMAVGLCSALWIASLAELPEASLAQFLGLAVASRLAMTLVLWLLPAARADGLGKMADGAARHWAWAIALLVALIWAVGAVPLIVMGAVTTLAAYTAKRRIGGQTGDVLGSIQFLSESFAWMTLGLLI